MRCQTSLAHCVSQDLKFFRGLAKSFRDEWPGQIYQLKKMDLKVGDVGAIKVKDRFVYHLITKEWCNDQPTYDNLRKSLTNMKEHMVENDISEVSLPKIGCGKNRLSWPVVKMMIEEVFDDTGIKITILCMDQKNEEHFCFLQDYSNVFVSFGNPLAVGNPEHNNFEVTCLFQLHVFCLV